MTQAALDTGVERSLAAGFDDDQEPRKQEGNVRMCAHSSCRKEYDLAARRSEVAANPMSATAELYCNETCWQDTLRFMRGQ